MEEFDYLIIGGGVVGCSILNKLTRLGKKVCLLEKESDVGMGASKANSGIIHTGLDCKPGTLKAELNVKGFNMYPKILDRLGVSYEVNGHLIVGNDREHITALYNQGIQNGVKDLEIIDSAKLHKLEPYINESILYALYAKKGMIVSSYELSVALAEEAIINGAVVKLQTTIMGLSEDGGEYIAKLTNGETIKTHWIINSAGAGFNEVSKVLGTEQLPIQYRRGEYYVLDKGNLKYCKHTIFPLPTKESKGVLITNTIGGNILVGPTSYVSDPSTITTNNGLKAVKNKALEEMPELPIKANIRVFSGVRSVFGEDFIIEKSKIKNNIIVLAGICSPGLSSAPAIAEKVAELVGLKDAKEISKLKALPKKLRLKELSPEKQDKLIKKNPHYGEIVCKCEEVSLGEIEDCISSPLGAKTVDAVKRRTRAGMGRCQSGFCIFRVMEQLARLNNSSFDKVEKDAVGSKIICSDIKPKEKK